VASSRQWGHVPGGASATKLVVRDGTGLPAGCSAGGTYKLNEYRRENWILRDPVVLGTGEKDMIQGRRLLGFVVTAMILFDGAWTAN
jgi:hypothetical protein